MEGIAVRIDYWTLPDGTFTGIEPHGISEFKDQLEIDYPSFVRGQSGGCGGGLYDLLIQLTTSITLRDFLMAIAGGMAYDAVKWGTKSLALKPLFSAIDWLKQMNPQEEIEIDVLKTSFQDVDVIIKRVSKEPIVDCLSAIFDSLSKHFESLRGKSGEPPYAIHIPIFEDRESNFCRYRCMLDVDETIFNITKDAYLKFWGARYNLDGCHRVYDVQNSTLMDIGYLTQEEYENEWGKHAPPLPNGLDF